MDIAGGFAHVNRPMIVSATAHYSKFAHDVLKGLGQLLSSHDPQELFARLHKLNARPAMHVNLESAIGRPQIHNTVCPADVSTVMDEIGRFLKR